MADRKNVGMRKVWLWQVIGKLREAGQDEAIEVLAKYYSADHIKVCSVRSCRMTHTNLITDRCDQHFDWAELKAAE